MARQQTTAGEVELQGVGLHSGDDSRIVFRPAPADHGIVFRRTDVEGQPLIPARVEQVSEVKRGTVLAKDGARVRTVEHVLAAAAALQIDNLLIDIDGEEPPAADGSAAPFVRALNEAGLEQQTGTRRRLELPRTVRRRGGRIPLRGPPGGRPDDLQLDRIRPSAHRATARVVSDSAGPLQRGDRPGTHVRVLARRGAAEGGRPGAGGEHREHGRADR